MISYNYDYSKPQKRYILRRMISIAILIFPFIMDQIADIEFVKSSYIYIILGFIVGIILKDLNHFHTYRIEFDEISKTIRFYSKNLLGKSSKSDHQFSNIKLHISSRKKKGVRKIYLIEFIRTKEVIVSIYNEQQRFNSDDLYFIYKTAESLSIETNLG